MKAIYAHYSTPYGGDIRNAHTHWAFPYVEFLLLAYSSAKMKFFGNTTTLVTDEYGKKLIIDELQIPFDEVLVELDNCEKKKRFWAAGKIYAYTKAIKEFEPYIMVDNDAGFHEAPPKELMDEPYLCQHIHHNNNHEFGNYVRYLVSKTPNVFPYGIFHEFEHEIHGCNSGIVVCNDKELHDEFSRYTWALMNDPFFDHLEKQATKPIYEHFSYWNVVVEEILRCCLHRRLRGKEPRALFDFHGFDFPPNTPNPHKYFHIWGSKRDEEFLKQRELLAVDFLPKELTDRIYNYFELATA